MPVKHTWHSDKMLHIQYQGLVTGREMIQAAIEAAGDARFDALVAIISDWELVKKVDVSVEELKELAAYIKAFTQTNSKIRNAAVIADKEQDAAMISLYFMLTEETPWTMKHFYSLEQAKEWALSKD